MNGQKVTFVVPGESPVVGYVFGVDDYHWAVVAPDGATTLVHKSTPLVYIAQEETYSSEENRESLEALIRPFRSFVLRTYFPNIATEDHSSVRPPAHRECEDSRT